MVMLMEGKIGAKLSESRKILEYFDRIVKDKDWWFH